MKKNDFSDFLKKHTITKQQKDSFIPTNTSIKGGSYYISDNDTDNFYKLYHNHVFVKKNSEFLTERQLNTDEAPILIDLDLKYSPEIKKRQHNEEDIHYIISVYFDKIKEFLILDNDKGQIPVYVFEKPNVMLVRKC